MSVQAHRSRPRVRPPPLIRIVHVNPPHIVHIDAVDFRSTVQSLTGWTNQQLSDTSVQSPSSSSSSSSCCSSPAANNPTNYHIRMPNYANDSPANHTQMVEAAANQAIDRKQKPSYANATCITHEPQSLTFIKSAANHSSPPSPRTLEAGQSSAMASTHLQQIQQSASSLLTLTSPCLNPTTSNSASEDDQNIEDDHNHDGDDDLYLCMMMELGDIEENDQREPMPLNFFDDTHDDEDLQHMRFLWSLQE